jgi:hypothetical protein
MREVACFILFSFSVRLARSRDVVVEAAAIQHREEKRPHHHSGCLDL